MAVAPPAPARSPAGRPAPAGPAPARTWRADAWRVAGLAVLSLAVHGWLVGNTSTTARDSIGFAQLALQYESPPAAVTPGPHATWADILRHGEPPHPPGYPLAVLAASKVVRAVSDGPLPEQMLRATQVASVAAAVLSVVPSYLLGCLLFGRFAGLAGGVILQVLPVLARVTSDGLTEALYLLFFTSGAAAGTWAVKRGGAGKYALAGLFSGLAYLVRPEGLIVALAVALAAARLGLAPGAKLRATAAALAAVVAGAAVPAAPYMAYIGGLTMKPSMEVFGPPAAARPAAVAGPLVAMNYHPSEDGTKAGWVPRAILTEAAKAFHYGVFGYAVVGVALAFPRLPTRPWLSVTIILGAGNLVLLAILANKAGYVSERHTLPVVVIGTFYAAYALEELPRRLARLPGVGGAFRSPAWPWVGLLALVGSCLPATVKPLHEGRAGHRHVAAVLAREATAEDVVVDPYTFAQYYSGRSVRGVPPDPANPRYRWAILEEGEVPHATLSRLNVAINIKNDKINPPVEAAAWADPADDRKGRRIVLYRQTVR